MDSDRRKFLRGVLPTAAIFVATAKGRTDPLDWAMVCVPIQCGYCFCQQLIEPGPPNVPRTVTLTEAHCHTCPRYKHNGESHLVVYPTFM